MPPVASSRDPRHGGPRCRPRTTRRYRGGGARDSSSTWRRARHPLRVGHGQTATRQKSSLCSPRRHRAARASTWRRAPAAGVPPSPPVLRLHMLSAARTPADLAALYGLAGAAPVGAAAAMKSRPRTTAHDRRCRPPSPSSACSCPSDSLSRITRPDTWRVALTAMLEPVWRGQRVALPGG
jgi:hypothetical protein